MTVSSALVSGHLGKPQQQQEKQAKEKPERVAPLTGYFDLRSNFMKNDINKPIGSSTDTNDFLFSYLVTNGRTSDEIHEINVRVSCVGSSSLSVAGGAVDAASALKDRYPNARVELLSFRPLTEEESNLFKDALVADASEE